MRKILLTRETCLSDVIDDCDKKQFIKLAKKETPETACIIASCSNRYDLLEELKTHRRYGRRARAELNHHEWMQKAEKAWEEKCAKYPAVFKMWQGILKKTRKLGIYDVSYPAMTAGAAGLDKEKYVAISGDGLFMFMLEILSLEGDGQFRVCGRPATPTYPHPEKVKRPDDDETMFKKLGRCKDGDVLDGTRVATILKKLYP